MISILNGDNYPLINDMAEMYNAERLKEYCNWFFRSHCFAIDTDMSMREE